MGSMLKNIGFTLHVSIIKSLLLKDFNICSGMLLVVGVFRKVVPNSFAGAHLSVHI
jgi:hypothetical protein